MFVVFLWLYNICILHWIIPGIFFTFRKVERPVVPSTCFKFNIEGTKTNYLPVTPDTPTTEIFNMLTTTAFFLGKVFCISFQNQTLLGIEELWGLFQSMTNTDQWSIKLSQRCSNSNHLIEVYFILNLLFSVIQERTLNSCRNREKII